MSIKIDKLIRSKRKSIALEISSDAQLIVRAGKYTPLHFIEKIIEEKAAWIKKKLTLAQKKLAESKSKKYKNGEKFLFMGKEFELEIVNEQKKALKLDHKFKLSAKNRKEAEAVFVCWYKKEAKKRISESVNLYSKMSGLRYRKLKITSAKTRWGSCSHCNNLNFSWRLVMAPIGVIDYVVVHELAHIAEKNHSRKFWQKVETIFPDYKIYKKWLKDNGHLLKL